MASFKTHLYGSVLASGGAVIGLQVLGLVPAGSALALFGLGVAGGLLPDVDAASSAPARAVFGLLGVILAFAWTLPLVGRLGMLELGLLWVGLFLSVRFLLYALFARYTVHRGLWHSLLAGVFAALATVHLCARLLTLPPATAWAAGAMVGIGFLTHLLLDEIASVDLWNRRVRRSFGSAMKPFSPRNPRGSLVLAGLVIALAWWAPPLPELPRPCVDGQGGPGAARQCQSPPSPSPPSLSHMPRATSGDVAAGIVDEGNDYDDDSPALSGDRSRVAG